MKIVDAQLLFALSLAVAAPAAVAVDAPAVGSVEQAVAVDSDQKTLKDYDRLIKMAEYLPNERYRLYAAKAAATGNWGNAAKMFRMAARYADKYSQHRLSLLYWYGVGVQQDRIEGYIWADLAAERGYPQFLAIREKMWRELTPQQQAAVAERGRTIYAEFGDPVAKKRFEVAVAQGKRKITGSHTGFITRLFVTTPGADRSRFFAMIPGEKLDHIYDQVRTDPQKYWQFENQLWTDGNVTVGDIEETSRKPKPQDPPTP